MIPSKMLLLNNWILAILLSATVLLSLEPTLAATNDPLQGLVNVNDDTQPTSSHYSDNDPDESRPLYSGIRVSPVCGGNKYGRIRFSRVWRRSPKDNSSAIGTHAFRHRWTQYSFETTIKEHIPGFPDPGGNVRGVIFGDVCISSKFVPCLYGKSYGTLHKITWLINTLAEQGALNFWGMLGDNLYDEDGSLTELFFSKLSLKAQETPLIAVPGNHDFWTKGGPSTDPRNQFGYGYAQFYMIDTLSSRGKHPNDFPFSFPPASKKIDSIPDDDSNFFHYSAMGGIGFIAFSGGHEMDRAKFEAACKYFLPGSPGQDVGFVFLLGHWSSRNMGCQENMFSGGVHRTMMMNNSSMPSCRRLFKENRLYFADGHFHENRALGQFGVRVGGQGMIDTGTFGFPLFQVTNEVAAGGKRVKRLLVSYIALARYPDDLLLTPRFTALRVCSKLYGVFGCLPKLSFVDTWLNVTTPIDV